MSVLQVNFASKSLRRQVTFNALLPIDTQNVGQMRSLYLLHGYSGNYMDWMCGTKIQELSQRFNIAVFMPSGNNSFYLDDSDKYENYGEYIGEELPEFTRKMFRLSDTVQDTWIGGLSMGGYGAIRNGLKYSKIYGRIIALSSALITNRVAKIPVGYKDGIADYNYYTRVFGDLSQLLGSDKDPFALYSSVKVSDAPVPKIYMACGTEDFLLVENREYSQFLKEQNADFTYVEAPGNHNMDFWNEYIEKGIEWALK